MPSSASGEERERFETASVDVMQTGLRAGNLMALMFPAVMLVMNVSSVAVIWFGAFQVQENGVEIGTLFAFLNYLMQILMGVMMATFMFVMIPRAAVCANRIGEVLDTEPSVVARPDPKAPPAAIGRIEFEHVDFAYPGAEEAVLHDLTFTVEPGTTTAIIGSTGAGKTTLVGLVPRLFDVTAGACASTASTCATTSPTSSGSGIGLIPQRAFLFSGTVASNLRYGDEEATDEELWRALELAQAKGFVEAMPGRARVPDRAGRHERVGRSAPAPRDRAGARVKQPGIYVFDDSFSALDLRTDAALRRALDTNLPDATRLVVAQRVTTIQQPTRSSCSSTGASSGWAPTTSWSRPTRPIARSSIRSSRRRRRHERHQDRDGGHAHGGSPPLARCSAAPWARQDPARRRRTSGRARSGCSERCGQTARC